MVTFIYRQFSTFQSAAHSCCGESVSQPTVEIAVALLAHL